MGIASVLSICFILMPSLIAVAEILFKKSLQTLLLHTAEVVLGPFH